MMILSGWVGSAGGWRDGFVTHDWFVELPNLDVVACIALSHLARQGFDGADVIGSSAVTTIAEFGTSTAPGPQVLPPDPRHNGVQIRSCTWIRFRLTVFDAAATAHAAAFSLDQSGSKFKLKAARQFVVRSQALGQTVATQRVSLLAKNSVVDENLFLARPLFALAGAFGCDEHDLVMTAAAREPGQLDLRKRVREWYTRQTKATSQKI